VQGSALKEAPSIEGAEPGKPFAVPAEGVVLQWKKGVAAVASVALFPAPDVKELPSAWEVQIQSGGKWRPVKEMEALVGPGLVEIRMAPQKVRKLRIVPAAATTLSKVECAGPLATAKPR
jgi:hypothetical protein